MPSDLKDLLDQAAERPSSEPDFAALARTGRRRRFIQRAASGLAVIAVIAATTTVVLPRMRPPGVAFDTEPKGGAGSWELIPAAPIGPREEAFAFADAERLVVIGGRVPDGQGGQGGPHQLDGAVFDRQTRQWELIPKAPFLGPMDYLEDGRLLVLAPNGSRAALYDIAEGTWSTTPASPASGSVEPFWQWTGDALLVWGGGRSHAEGAVWHEESGQWTAMAPAPIRSRFGMSTVWTGTQLFVWGGVTGDPMRGKEVAYADGATYDPATDTWQRLPASPLSPRQSAAAWWDGSRVVLSGGDSAENRVDDADAEVEPESDGECTEAGDGSQAVVTCGMSAEVGLPQTTWTSYHDGAAYDPDSRTWTRITEAPSGRHRTPFLVDDQLVALNRKSLSLYDTGRDVWRGYPRAPADASSYGTMHRVADRLVVTNTTGVYNFQRTGQRIGGYTLNEKRERWESLAEADTPRRTSAAIAVADDALFVWGGSIITHVGQGAGDYNTFEGRADGAILTLD